MLVKNSYIHDNSYFVKYEDFLRLATIFFQEEFAAKEKLEIVNVQDFGSEFLIKSFLIF